MMVNGTKIKKMRELKNITQEFMAKQLGITQSAYSKLEAKDTEISAEQIKKIATILQIPTQDIAQFADLFDRVIMNEFNNSHNNSFSPNSQYTFQTAEKELYEKLLQEKDETISSLKREIETLRELLALHKKS
ncbi:MAG: XRE family transcriptional regulator [Cytophagales bacterium]|nr:MAG: XRE family transcriptional regulator [Cytophagales bacterium]